MKNIVGLSVLVILFSSCGLFFIDGANDKQLTPLATTDGGYLSTDDHNEICPFLYRSSTGDAYLFYSSDRDGSYDIYAAKMNANGDFETPVRLQSPINETTSKEISPVVFYDNMNSQTVLTFIRMSSNTNVVYFSININGLTNTTSQMNINYTPTGLGIMGSYLMLSFGDTNVMKYSYYYPSWNLASPDNFSKKPYSISGLSLSYTNMDYAYLYIEEIASGSKHALSAEGVLSHYTGLPPTYQTNLPFNISTPFYQSEYNDITPSIDYEGGFKVYFASDRFGKGNYDLYRYNIYTLKTLPEVEQLLGWDTTPPLVTISQPTNNQAITNVALYVTTAADYGISGGSSVYAVYCSLDDGGFIRMNMVGTNWMYTYNTVSDGPHTLLIYGMDCFGNMSETNKINCTFTLL